MSKKPSRKTKIIFDESDVTEKVRTTGFLPQLHRDRNCMYRTPEQMSQICQEGVDKGGSPLFAKRSLFGLIKGYCAYATEDTCNYYEKGKCQV